VVFLIHSTVLRNLSWPFTRFNVADLTPVGHAHVAHLTRLPASNDLARRRQLSTSAPSAATSCCD